MMLTADETAGSNIASTVCLIVFLSFAVVYLLGYRRAVMHRANRDYKTIKAGLKPARKNFWSAWWGVVKIGFWVALIAIALIAYAARGDRKADANPGPSPSTTRATHSR